jgi:hypothetical protein
MNNPFTGIETAEQTAGGRYITPGRYTLQVVQPKLRESKNPEKRGVTYFIADFRVVETTSEDYQQGDTVSWLVDLSKNQALGDVKAFASALVGGDAEVTAESMMAICQPENPTGGLAVKCEAYGITTSKGNPFTKITWSAA